MQASPQEVSDESVLANSGQSDSSKAKDVAETVSILAARGSHLMPGSW